MSDTGLSVGRYNKHKNLNSDIKKVYEFVYRFKLKNLLTEKRVSKPYDTKSV